jgi:hypothetical protein
LQLQSVVVPRTPPAGPVGPLAPDRYIITNTRHFEFVGSARLRGPVCLEAQLYGIPMIAPRANRVSLEAKTLK